MVNIAQKSSYQGAYVYKFGNGVLAPEIGNSYNNVGVTNSGNYYTATLGTLGATTPLTMRQNVDYGGVYNKNAAIVLSLRYIQSTSGSFAVTEGSSNLTFTQVPGGTSTASFTDFLASGVTNATFANTPALSTTEHHLCLIYKLKDNSLQIFIDGTPGPVSFGTTISAANIILGSLAITGNANTKLRDIHLFDTSYLVNNQELANWLCNNPNTKATKWAK